MLQGTIPLCSPILVETSVTNWGEVRTICLMERRLRVYAFMYARSRENSFTRKQKEEKALQREREKERETERESVNTTTERWFAASNPVFGKSSNGLWRIITTVHWISARLHLPWISWSWCVLARQRRSQCCSKRCCRTWWSRRTHLSRKHESWKSSPERRRNYSSQLEWKRNLHRISREKTSEELVLFGNQSSVVHW